MAHGRYTIVGKLADGGMAEIFLALQKGAEGFQKRVVLKRVLTAFSADPQFRNMFLDEAHISMSLAHGNIVQVLDVGVAGERTFLVLELVEGWDLEKIMERAQATGPEHPWPPSLALYVTGEVCRGLAYAHAKRGPDGRPLGIVHRDVSPNNVLISEQGEVKVADFGIAKAESKREQTMAGVIKGKIGFMSPEQALGRPLDARADLFSVGTVMYLMLTGRRPFEAGSELDSMMLAQRAEYQPPEKLNPYLSSEATTIVNRAMQRDPADRYQTAHQMLVDVERVLRAEYNSAGQTELKLWLAELGRRDSAAPIGRLPVVEADSARPVFVDESGELSAGSSVELSDMDGSAGPTAVGMQPTSGAAVAVVDATATSQPALAKTVSAPAMARASTPVGSGGEPAVVVHQTPASGASAAGAPTVGTPAAGAPAITLTTNRRLPRRSRVGLGFLLGAVCMLGAVFGIRWLAAWAGRERLGLPGWGLIHPDASSTENAPVAQQAATPPSPPTGATGATPSEDTAEAHAAAASTGAGAATGSPDADAGKSAVAAEKPDEGDAPASDAPPSRGVATVAGTLEDDEDRLLDRMVPGAAPVIGEDDAEDNPRDKRGRASAKEQTKSSGGAADTKSDSKKSGRSSRSTEAEKTRAAGTGKGASAQAQHAQPVQIRITTSPLGAVVRTKKQVLGRTPLALHFDPGSTYELTFVKSGYVTDSRRVSVASGKTQSISVAMKKASPPPPRRTGFLRGR